MELKGSEAEQTANSVVKWVASQPGGRVHASLQARHDPYGGIGLFIGNSDLEVNAETLIKKGEELFAVPRSCMIEVPRGTPTRHHHAALALQLLDQRNLAKDPGSESETCKWRVFLESIPGPKDMSGMLLLRHMATRADLDLDLEPDAYQRLHSITAEGLNADALLERQLISCSPLLNEAFEIQFRSVMTEYRSILSGEIPLPIQSGAPPSLPDYVWARCIVSSRAIHLWAGPTLVPLADFLNHSKPPNVVLRCCTPEIPGNSGGGDPPRSRCGKGRSIYSPPPSSSEETEDDNSEACLDSDDDGLVGENDHEADGIGDLSAHRSLRDQQSFVCEAIRDLLPGEEVHWVYNSHILDVGWLLGYGFVPMDGSSSPSCHADQLKDPEAAVSRISAALEAAASSLAGVCCGVSGEVINLLMREREFILRIGRSSEDELRNQTSKPECVNE